MFSYYGTKKALASWYEPPRYETIIEPFAGAAGYSCLYPEKEVILYDSNPKIYSVWNYLISAEKSQIENLPNIETGQTVNDFDLSPPERDLIGFCINPGSSTPKITASKRSKWGTYKKQLAEFVPKIKHWKIVKESYVYIDNQEATWFIDPPYQKAGKYYFGYKQLDFKQLGRWCKERSGQVIVCENEGADWLPFRFLTEHRGSIQKNVEVIWTNDPCSDNEQNPFA